jgi:hypothetical protein
VSVYYYLACDQCRERLPFWGRGIGGVGLLRPASDDADAAQEFIDDHEEHSLRFVREQRPGLDEYSCPFEDQ